jgi:hypothetical protein
LSWFIGKKILIFSGTCSFVQKVKNVEKIGGHVALIINNNADPIEYIVMSDDGRGRDITIPGVLISQSDGFKLSDFYRTNKDNQKVLDSIVLEVDFEMEHSSNTVKYDIYMSSDNEAVYKLLKELTDYQRELGDQAILNVHYITYQSVLYSKNTPIEIANCLGAGKYCAQPGKFKTSEGRVIVKENIRQACIFRYARDQNKPEIYTTYMTNFFNKCLDKPDPDFSEECASLITQQIPEITDNAINVCINNSFKPLSTWVSGDKNLYMENTILDQENKDRNDYLVSFLPTILINGRNFWGSWRADNVFEAICAGFKKKPEVCYDEGAFKRDSSMGWFGISMIVILIIAVNAVVFYFCKNYIRRKIVERIESTDINHKINTVVTSYLALRDSK